MYDKTSFGNMAKKNFWEKSTVEGNVLLRNKPDHGGAIGYVVALFPVLFLLLLFYAFIQEEWTWEGGIDALLDLLTIVAVAALPLLLYSPKFIGNCLEEKLYIIRIQVFTSNRRKL